MASNDLDATTVVLLLLGVIVLLPLLMMTIGVGGMMGYGGMTGQFGTTSGWVPLAGFLVMVLFFVLIIGGGVLLLQRASGGTREHDSAMEELRNAYARGDLSEEEFDRRKQKLEREE
ncbi:MAG: SHOCT domain-containing protein [Halobacteriota archaeon]